ncbi:MAG TPA: ubiquinone/menaquinone biosynthesis methyltransferase [Geopsychrobacteraceae bacterium]|nr:ubiquinone/menaquinone biosynthesis methyltransferase [Geopsychrobacteraceae bacterium]
MGEWRDVFGIEQKIDSPDKKRDFNERHFTEAASRYDVATRVMSLGRDQAWKSYLVSSLPELIDPVCVDLASGTGDIAFLLAERFPQAQITGIDLTEEMVTLADQRNRFEHVSFACQDMGGTDFEDQSVDIVTGSYALRNAPDLAVGLQEVNRILKPGGYAVFLDFSKTGHPLVQNGQYWLLKCWCGLWGTLLHANPTIHAYIADSLKQFPARDDYYQLVRQSGFELVSSQLFYFGMLELLVVKKKD